MQRLEWQAQTDRGSVRENNEDSFAACPDIGIWAVADGMGGHERGEWASARLVEALQAVAPDEGFDGLLRACSDAVHAANAAIFAEGSALGVRMGSTIVSLVIAGNQFGIIWAGDSRAYVLRDQTLHQLTRDHTQVQALLDRGMITPGDAQAHPMAHVLAKAIGVEPVVELEAIADTVAVDDVFLLCSDGLHGVLPHDELRELLGSGAPSECVGRLVARCLEIGASDNVTVVVIRVREPTNLVFASSAELDWRV
jgi:serine/threonine protein phosphatase PrpC